MIVDLNLKDRIVLVIGAGLEGTKRIANLSKEDCQIIVLSDRVSEEFYEIEGSTCPIILIRRRIKDINFLHTFNNVFLILAATNDSFLNNRPPGTQYSPLRGSFFRRTSKYCFLSFMMIASTQMIGSCSIILL